MKPAEFCKVPCPLECGTLIAVKRGKYRSLPSSAKKCVNRHLLYCHPGLRPRKRSLLTDEAALSIEVTA